MTVWAGDDFKTILRYAKLARLMHTIERQSSGQYVFRFDGPSSVLRPSRRYGVAMAKFLPALLACRDWRMQATIRHRRSNWQNLFRLSPADGLQSHLPSRNEFDSALEENFANRWGTEPREGWSLIREGEVLHSNQKVFVPDFVFQHQSGLRVLMEVVGFWTPEYLAAKLKTLRVFQDRNILLVISNTLDLPGDEAQDATYRKLTVDSIRYKTSIRIDDVLDRLRARLSD
jgi:predicted nuclease of restriction endonuclease-like RecB superfamily